MRAVLRFSRGLLSADKHANEEQELAEQVNAQPRAGAWGRQVRCS